MPSPVLHIVVLRTHTSTVCLYAAATLTTLGTVADSDSLRGLIIIIILTIKKKKYPLLTPLARIYHITQTDRYVIFWTT